MLRRLDVSSLLPEALLRDCVVLLLKYMAWQVGSAFKVISLTNKARSGPEVLEETIPANLQLLDLALHCFYCTLYAAATLRSASQVAWTKSGPTTCRL